MFTHDDILLPLALTVMIDHKIKDPELKELRQQASALFKLFELDPKEDDELTRWFEDIETELNGTLNGRRKNTVILRALTRFSEDAHVEAMYDAMVSISVADQEYRREESELVRSAAAIWGFQRPPLKVVD
ncbi:MAG: TerB family tellurite resistance protein [Hellea sp.]|nr:TerB family tellurite resistance protein [Hellea sp.]